MTSFEKKGKDWAALLFSIRDCADRGAFVCLFRHFAPCVKAYFVKSGITGSAAEDCTQDVMASVWQKAALYDPVQATVSTWVYAIARNRRIDFLRKSNRPEPEHLSWGEEYQPEQAELYAAQQEMEFLSNAISQLPEAQRFLIERAYYADMSHGEISAETGLPLGTVKSRIRLALEKLRAGVSRKRHARTNKYHKTDYQ